MDLRFKARVLTPTLYASQECPGVDGWLFDKMGQINMNEELIHVFLVDDDEDDYVLTRDLLAEAVEARFELEWADTYEAGLEAMERAQHHVYLLDYRLGERDGLELLCAAIASGCKVPIIMLTGRGDHAVDVVAMKAGAVDYLDKSELSAPLLERSIRYAIERVRVEEELSQYREHLEELVEQRTTELTRANEQLQKEITEHKQVEEALRESEERLRSLFETMAEGVVVIAPDGQIVQANPAAERILGLKRPEIEGRNYVGPEWEILRPDGTRMPPEEMAGPRAMKEKRLVKDVVMGVKRPDGSISWINVSAAPLITESGEFEGVVGTFVDITERKRAEETIRRQLAEIASYYDNAPIGLAALDTNLRYLRINDRLAEINGIPAAAHIGKTVKEIVPTLEAQAREVTVEILRTGQPVTDIEFSGETAAQPGVNRSWLESWHPLKGENGNIIGFAVMVLDITERKRSEEALREAEKRYRDLYDSAPVMYHTIDTKGIVLECNQTEADMLGYSKEEIIGQPIYAFETKEYQDLAPHALREGMEKGHAVGERRFVRKDGTIIDAALDATAIYDDSGQVVGFRSTFTDITERKRAEEALRRSLEETAHGQRTLLALSQAAQAVQRAHTPDEVYQTVGDEVTQLGYHAVIFTLTDDREHLALRHLTFEPTLVRRVGKLTGLSAQDFRFALSLGGCFQRVITEGEAIFRESSLELMAEALPEPLHPLVGRLVAMLGIEQGIVAPLTVGGERLGILAVTGAGLTEADVPAVTAFANQAAIALENARLFEQVRAGSERWQRSNGKLRSSPNGPGLTMNCT